MRSVRHGKASYKPRFVRPTSARPSTKLAWPRNLATPCESWITVKKSLKTANPWTQGQSLAACPKMLQTTKSNAKAELSVFFSLALYRQRHAHAQADGYQLLTRDAGRYKTYFPKIKLICP